MQKTDVFELKVTDQLRQRSLGCSIWLQAGQLHNLQGPKQNEKEEPLLQILLKISGTQEQNINQVKSLHSGGLCVTT